MAFNLDEIITGTKRNTACREQIEYISVDLIVSGHRRFAAIRQLIADGHEELRDMPCIVEDGTDSPEMQQLRLIYANSATRVLTSAELSRQAVEVEELLYKLKEQDVEFSGRMRDHVAKAVNASKSKLARLKVIREGLSPEILPEWEAGKLNDGAALALARLDHADQLRIFHCAHCNGYMGESVVNDCAKGMEQVRDYKCKKTGGKCAHIGHMEQRILDSGRWSTAECLRSRCCLNCDHLRDCKDPCSHAVEKKLQLREQRRAEQKTAREKQLAEDAVKIAFITGVYRRIQQRRQEIDVSLPQLLSGMGMYYNASTDNEYARYAAGDKVRPTTSLPFAYGCNENEYHNLVRAAEILQCSTDFLLGREDVPTMGTIWNTGNPPKTGRYLLAYRDECGGSLNYESCLWSEEQGWLLYGTLLVDADVVAVKWTVLADET